MKASEVKAINFFTLDRWDYGRADCLIYRIDNNDIPIIYINDLDYWRDKLISLTALELAVDILKNSEGGGSFKWILEYIITNNKLPSGKDINKHKLMKSLQ